WPGPLVDPRRVIGRVAALIRFRAFDRADRDQARRTEQSLSGGGMLRATPAAAEDRPIGAQNSCPTDPFAEALHTGGLKRPRRSTRRLRAQACSAIRS